MLRAKLPDLVEKQLGSGHWADPGDIPVQGPGLHFALVTHSEGKGVWTGTSQLTSGWGECSINL